MTRAAVRERAQARRAADAAFREAFDAYMFECFAKPGFKLESEAQLAERFGVTRYKVRKAIEALNQAGVLERVKHGGSTVRSVTPEELADRADRLLSVAGLPAEEFEDAVSDLVCGLVPVIMDFVTSLLHQERSEVYMTGQARLLGQPEYHDIDKAQKMLTTLDEDVVSNLPAALSSDSRTQILVGPENVSKELKDTSVVMTKFDIGDGMQGLIGVVGPTRMDYAQITARLSYFAENLSRMFQKSQTPAIEGPENKHNDPEA